MKTFIITWIILTIFSIGIKIGNKFQAMEFSPQIQLLTTAIQIAFLIWACNII